MSLHPLLAANSSKCPWLFETLLLLLGAIWNTVYICIAPWNTAHLRTLKLSALSLSLSRSFTHLLTHSLPPSLSFSLFLDTFARKPWAELGNLR